MAENAPTDNNANAENQPNFAIQRFYCKDLSFESPKSPQSFQNQWKPKINLDLNTKSTLIQDDLYEVVLTLTIKAENNDDTAFVVEVQQAGLFVVKNFPEAQKNQMLGAFCPNVLFPYARETVDSLILRGSFPPIMLAPVNFDALYAQNQQKKEAENQH